MESVKSDKRTCYRAHRCTEDNEGENLGASETQHPGVFHCFDVRLFDLVGCSTKLDGSQSRPYLCQCYVIVRLCQLHKSEFLWKVNHVFPGLITNLCHTRRRAAFFMHSWRIDVSVRWSSLRGINTRYFTPQLFLREHKSWPRMVAAFKQILLLLGNGKFQTNCRTPPNSWSRRLLIVTNHLIDEDSMQEFGLWTPTNHSPMHLSHEKMCKVFYCMFATSEVTQFRRDLSCFFVLFSPFLQCIIKGSCACKKSPES